VPHFHDFNPWANTLIYLPDLEEFLEALPDDEVRVYSEEGTSRIARNRTQYQNQITSLKKYDLYVLKDGELGVRFGKEGNQYLSPYSDKEKAKALWAKYSGAQPE
jgi:hypothetical protein